MSERKPPRNTTVGAPPAVLAEASPVPSGLGRRCTLSSEFMACYLPHPSTSRQHVSVPTILQIVPTLDGGGIARAALDAAQAVISAGGTAIVASPGGSLVPELLR